MLPWILAAVFMAKPVRKKRKTHEIIIISWGNSKRKTFNNDSQSKEPKFKFIFLSIHRKNGRNEAFNNNYVSTDVNSTYSLITCELTNHAVRAQCTVHLFVIQLYINTWYRKSFSKYFPLNHYNFRLYKAVTSIGQSRSPLTACHYCSPPVLNGHWRLNHSDKQKIIF